MASTVFMLIMLIASVFNFGWANVLGNYAIRTSREQLQVVPQMSSGTLKLIFTGDNDLSVRIEYSVDGKFSLRRRRKIAAPFYYLSHSRMFVLMPLERELDMNMLFKAHVINEVGTRGPTHGQSRQQMGEQIMYAIFSNTLPVEETADHIVKALGSAVNYATIVADIISPNIQHFAAWQPINIGAEQYSIPPSPITTKISFADGATCSIRTSVPTIIHTSPRHLQVSNVSDPGAFVTISTGVGDLLTLKEHFQGKLFIINPNRAHIICYEQGMKICLHPTDILLYVSDAMKMEDFLVDIDEMGLKLDANNFIDLAMAHFAALNAFIMEFPASIIIMPQVHRRVSQLQNDRRRHRSH